MLKQTSIEFIDSLTTLFAHKIIGISHMIMLRAVISRQPRPLSSDQRAFQPSAVLIFLRYPTTDQKTPPWKYVFHVCSVRNSVIFRSWSLFREWMLKSIHIDCCLFLGTKQMTYRDWTLPNCCIISSRLFKTIEKVTWGTLLTFDLGFDVLYRVATQNLSGRQTELVTLRSITAH
jgi:hypothetical protein